MTPRGKLAYHAKLDTPSEGHIRVEALWGLGTSPSTVQLVFKSPDGQRAEISMSMGMAERLVQSLIDAGDRIHTLDKGAKPKDHQP